MLYYLYYKAALPLSSRFTNVVSACSVAPFISILSALERITAGQQAILTLYARIILFVLDGGSATVQQCLRRDERPQSIKGNMTH
jgi:hypothetical protein